jgi:phosphate starvation-inducible membrane PsiE
MRRAKRLFERFITEMIVGTDNDKGYMLVDEIVLLFCYVDLP